MVAPRGKKLLVVGYQLFFHGLPLAQEEPPHHLVALGEALGLEVVQSGWRLQSANVRLGNVDALQFGEALRLALLFHAADQNRQVAHR